MTLPFLQTGRSSTFRLGKHCRPKNIPPSPDIVGERYKVLHEISKSKEPHIILSSLQACLQKLIPQKNFNSMYMGSSRQEIVLLLTI